LHKLRSADLLTVLVALAALHVATKSLP
jgi:hypothetical protein